MDRVRVLRIITRLNLGGPAIQALHLHEAFSGEFSTLLVAGALSEGEVPLCRELGPNVVRVMDLKREPSLRGDVRAFLELRRVVKAFRPHVVHTHMAKAGFLGRLAALTVRPRPKPVRRARC